MKQLRYLAFAAAYLLGAAATQAQTVDDKLHIHGFGDWVYGKSNGNDYQSADEEGRYDDAAVGLNLRYDASDSVAIVTQIAWEHAEGRAADAETLLDYAFVQWTRNDRFHVRIGRTYHPFGLYSEIRDIGTARPFIERPPEVYEAVGIASESLQGINLYGDLPSSSRWGLHYDLYGGATDLPLLPAGAVDTEEEILKVRNVIGGRLTIDTPVSGLRGQLSAFTGSAKEDDRDENHTSVGVSIDYTSEKWSVRAEAARHRESDERANGAYVEAAYRVAGPWQLAGRVGRISSSHNLTQIDSRFERQRDIAAGVNYWLDPRVVLKGEVHFLDGNRLALAETLEDTKEKTRAFQFAVQFAF